MFSVAVLGMNHALVYFFNRCTYKITKWTKWTAIKRTHLILCFLSLS